MHKSRTVLAVLAAALLFASGCTRSLEYTFRSDTAGGAAQPKKTSIGIAKFEDKRQWVMIGTEKSESFIAQQGTWKFGLTHKGAEYTPVKNIIQDIFVSEFANAGIQAKAVDAVLSKSNRADMARIGNAQNVDYLLGGEIHVFEFVNEMGVWTMSSRRAVTLSLLLLDVKADAVLVDNMVNEMEREHEGMGILHSTNVNKLMNGVFKKALKSTVDQVTSKMKLVDAHLRIEITYQGKVYEVVPLGGDFAFIPSPPAQS